MTGTPSTVVVAPRLGVVGVRDRARGVTGREMEVLSTVVDGLGNPEIATRLRLSRRTVQTHVANLLATTGAADRGGLAIWLGEGDALAR